MVHDSAPHFRAKPMEAEKKETGKEYTCRKEIPYLEQKLEEKGSKKKVQKYSTKKILQVQSEVKKKKKLVCQFKGGGNKDNQKTQKPPQTPTKWPFPLKKKT